MALLISRIRRAAVCRALTLVALAGAIVLTSTSYALAETQATPVAQTSSADFGSPPSGQIPILYNDRHVYSKPDVLKAGRVLAAYARGGTIYLPLRSMFEQMGATVSYDPSSQTATVTKPGATINVTVGKPEVIINGESRPLDVPPMIYHGVVLVPVRVISESMGTYVQWVSDRRLVVVRYIPATPPPTRGSAAGTGRDGCATAAASADAQSAQAGRIRSFVLFTRQNASNNPGAQFDYTPGREIQLERGQRGAWNTGISIDADYGFPGAQWSIGASYFYANPMDGPCVVAANHAKGAVCVTRNPPRPTPMTRFPASH